MADAGDMVELGAPEQQGLVATTSSLVRVDSFGSQASWRPGVTFASISMERSSASAHGAPHLIRTSLTRGGSRLSRSAGVPDPAAAVPSFQAAQGMQQAPADMQGLGMVNGGGSGAPMVGVLVAETLPTVAEEASQYPADGFGVEAVNWAAIVSTSQQAQGPALPVSSPPAPDAS